jgi:two-component system CheB/CheR fusion protein
MIYRKIIMRTTKNNTKILKDLSPKFYNQIIDSLQDYSIFTLDEDLFITTWSSGSKKIFGYETEEIIGEHIDIIFTEEDKKNAVPKHEVELALKEGRATDNRWHICKDGGKIFALGIMFPLLDDNGSFLGYVKILKDLTEKWFWEEERKKYVKGLEELIIHKESILSVISHDLRSPLSGIISITDYLETDLEKMKQSELKTMIGILHKSSREELAMLDYLVKWARIKYPSDIFTPKKIELAQSVIKAFNTLNETGAKDAVTLHSEVDNNIIVFADERMLLSIVQNLISNAIKHSHKGGKVNVMAKRDDNNVTVQIKDTGTGMSKEVHEKLFTPQMKFLSNFSENNNEVGLGLLLVKGFLDVHGGKIWVESKEGEGSSFYFTLPVNEHLEKETKNANNISETS